MIYNNFSRNSIEYFPLTQRKNKVKIETETIYPFKYSENLSESTKIKNKKK